ncbi:bifunctional hydroxymethylpyrimidine kinase/phosphomethylpyrimidine kinase [Flavobacterium rakeshii]|uniref:bifunctional hydroxymethylpyrimidine kinase/phosphomethylpyrimidine kinase n=1 Tax=Flavobacterium rakeshii TaxID=1038845 RepID=UPI002E7ABC92|nr:bifunctional hydroxymethylpyrimidine kinase/phosphomethylpyrimidine kinase [Flavobacterium rakeshii]MEE1899223.1 bifunctional hydroxymethylpyrimidine kinase/phosphomethylpyrimidine kinase [Flavobacterium rakeshii]
MKKKYTYPTVLTIAGTDPSGGAGIQADLKTFSALGCYGMSVITALVAQNTTGVRGIHNVPAQFVEQQLDAVMEDIRPNAIKIGMVHTSQLVEVIAATLKKYPDIPVVFDPVMVATSGDKLIEDTTIAVIVSQLFPLVTLITPNMDEASLLANMPIETVAQMQQAGKVISATGCKALLMKGGHLQTEQLTSILMDRNGVVNTYVSNKVDTNNVHGSGCTLSSAIASYLARGEELQNAVALAQEYINGAIYHGRDVLIGNGNGPLNHFYNPQTMIKNEME